DRTVDSQRECERVARPGIERDVLAPRTRQLESRVIGALDELTDDHTLEPSPKGLDEAAHQVVREWTRGGHALQRDGESLRLERSDPDGQAPTPPGLLDELHHRAAGVRIEPDRFHFDFDLCRSTRDRQPQETQGDGAPHARNCTPRAGLGKRPRLTSLAFPDHFGY